MDAGLGDVTRRTIDVPLGEWAGPVGSLMAPDGEQLRSARSAGISLAGLGRSALLPLTIGAVEERAAVSLALQSIAAAPAAVVGCLAPVLTNRQAASSSVHPRP